MLLELTLKCNEGCSHCFDDAGSGPDMSRETLAESIEFLEKVHPFMLQVTGGEFTLHPEYFDAVNTIHRRLSRSLILLESNGWWFEEVEHVSQITELLSLPRVFGLQIRTDKRYYPNYERIWGNRNKIEGIHSKIKVYEGEIELVPLGRAKNLLKDNPNKSPMCANLILVSRQMPLGSFSSVVQMLNFNGKFCAPSIDPLGGIHAGESCLCQRIGHVSDDPEVIHYRLSHAEFCGKCGLKIREKHLRSRDEKGGQA